MATKYIIVRQDTLEAIQPDGATWGARSTGKEYARKRRAQDVSRRAQAVLGRMVTVQKSIRELVEAPAHAAADR